MGGPRPAHAGAGRVRRSRRADVAGRLSRPLARARTALQPDLRLSLRERPRAGGAARRDSQLRRAGMRRRAHTPRTSSCPRIRAREPSPTCGAAGWRPTARAPIPATTSGGTCCPPARTRPPSSARSSHPAPIVPASASSRPGRRTPARSIASRTHCSPTRPEELRGTRILTSSPTAPGMPYVTGAATSDDDIAKMRDGLRAAIADPSLAPHRARAAPHRRERADGPRTTYRIRGVFRDRGPPLTRRPRGGAGQRPAAVSRSSGRGLAGRSRMWPERRCSMKRESRMKK